jgi:hypothetical protein
VFSRGGKAHRSRNADTSRQHGEAARVAASGDIDVRHRRPDIPRREGTPAGGAVTGVRRSSDALELIVEAKVADLLDGVDDLTAASLEPSGVCVHDGAFYVIFDNVSTIARIEDLSARSPANRLLGASIGGAGKDTEDITFDPVSGHFFVLSEAVKHGNELLGEVYEHEPDGTPLGHAFLDVALETRNKGLEGLGCIVRDGEVLLLGLCEGNRCKGGKAGRRPGGGRIHVFRRGPLLWEREATIRLPKDMDFIDYASVAVRGDRIAVLSQSSSALWVGTLATTGFAVDEGGTIYEFPRDADHRVVYGTVEGVSWLTDDRLVMVSDRAKGNTLARTKEQSLHVFRLPSSK